MINNLMYPLLMGMALGKKKGLTKQESTRAAMLSYAGSAVGGNAGTILGTMSAVNAEALKNEVEQCKAAKNTAEAARASAVKEQEVLLKDYDVRGNKLIIKINEDIEDIIERRNPKVVDKLDNSNGKVQGVVKKGARALLSEVAAVMGRAIADQLIKGVAQVLVSRFPNLTDVIEENNADMKLGNKNSKRNKAKTEKKDERLLDSNYSGNDSI